MITRTQRMSQDARMAASKAIDGNEVKFGRNIKKEKLNRRQDI